MKNWTRLFRAPLMMLWVLSSSGCMTWHSSPNAITRPSTPNQRIKLCVGTTCKVVRGIKISGDSLSAIPYFHPLTCDSCRIHYALNTLTSIEEQEIDNGPTIAIGVVAVLAFLFNAAMKATQ